MWRKNKEKQTRYNRTRTSRAVRLNVCCVNAPLSENTVWRDPVAEFGSAEGPVSPLRLTRFNILYHSLLKHGELERFRAVTHNERGSEIMAVTGAWKHWSETLHWCCAHAAVQLRDPHPEFTARRQEPSLNWRTSAAANQRSPCAKAVFIPLSRPIGAAPSGRVRHQSRMWMWAAVTGPHSAPIPHHERVMAAAFFLCAALSFSCSAC